MNQSTAPASGVRGLEAARGRGGAAGGAGPEGPEYMNPTEFLPEISLCQRQIHGIKAIMISDQIPF